IAHENLSDPPRSPEQYETELTKRMDPEEGFKYMMDSSPLIPGGCRCGFKILEKEGGFALEGIGRKNMDTYGEEKRKQIEDEVEKHKQEALKQMEETDMDAALLVESFDAAQKTPEESDDTRKIKDLLENIAPGIHEDPADIDITRINLKGIDDLNAHMQQMAADKKKETLDMLRGELDRLNELDEDLPGREIAVLQFEKMLEDIQLPPVLPRFDFDSHLKNAREQIEAVLRQETMVLHSLGIEEADLAKLKDAVPDAGQIEAQISAAREKACGGYRIGAHYIEEARSPHEGKEAEIASDLLKRHQEGGETTGGDYAFTDLSGMDLSGIDLSGAYLEYADLSHAKLAGANLSNAVLSHAVLVETDLTNADLSGANLGASRIDGARFIDSNLTGVILGKASIRYTKFHRCKLIERMEMFLETEFEQVDFTGSDMRRSNFIDADISGCCFAEVDLTESSFLNPEMTDAVFDRAVLHNVNFVKARGENVSFRQADMNNVRFVGGCGLPRSDFSGAEAAEANFRDCRLDDTDFSEAFLMKADFSGSSLIRSRFIRADAVQAQFQKSNLVFADLHRINLMEGSLLKARLSGAVFTEANLYMVNFLNTIIGEEDIDQADFTDAYLG
ncbi:MAG: pentapeptide repeat-containing protein, partial [Desulfococcaceae bacterium]